MSASEVFQELLISGKIAAEDVARLRTEIFADGVTDLEEAEAVFRLNDGCPDKHESWNELYVDALTDFYVWRATPPGYVDEENARHLIRYVVRDNRIASDTELALLASVIHWADSVPAELAEFVLSAVKESVLEPDEAAYGQGRRPNVIDAVDVELIKRAIYAPATQGSVTVTRAEADAIFDLNDATIEAENHAGWKSLFVYAVANHLMFPRNAAPAPSAQEVIRREQWLKERHGMAPLLLQVGRGAVDLAADVLSLHRDDLEARFESAQKAMEGSAQPADAAEQADAAAAAFEKESISEEEANWLIERIGRDGVLHANEISLLTFIKNTAPKTPPSMDPLFEEAGFS
jgi:hypothetical protein